MELFLIIIVIISLIILILGFDSFRNGFRAKFSRNFIHWENLVIMVFLLIALLAKSQSDLWTVLFFIACVVIIFLGIWQIKKYGFGWGFGVWIYNIMLVFLVLYLIYVVNSTVDSIKNRKR